MNIGHITLKGKTDRLLVVGIHAKVQQEQVAKWEGDEAAAAAGAAVPSDSGRAGTADGETQRDILHMNTPERTRAN